MFSNPTLICMGSVSSDQSDVSEEWLCSEARLREKKKKI